MAYPGFVDLQNLCAGSISPAVLRRGPRCCERSNALRSAAQADEFPLLFQVEARRRSCRMWG